MESRRARIKAAKKAAKEEKRKANGTTSDASAAKKIKMPPPEASSSKGLKNGIEKSKKSIKSVQNDPSKSEVYKSLFSTHKTALNKPKGNWVTFDPRYN